MNVAPAIRYETQLDAVDWHEMKAAVAADAFDNGRTADQLRRSFANSFACVVAYADGRIVGTARALSDGVGNAYIVDVWTTTALRRRGIASAMMRLLEARLDGQHIALFSSDAAALYRSLGYGDEPAGFGKIVGCYLKSTSG